MSRVSAKLVTLRITAGIVSLGDRFSVNNSERAECDPIAFTANVHLLPSKMLLQMTRCQDSHSAIIGLFEAQNCARKLTVNKTA